METLLTIGTIALAGTAITMLMSLLNQKEVVTHQKTGANGWKDTDEKEAEIEAKSLTTFLAYKEAKIARRATMAVN